MVDLQKVASMTEEEAKTDLLKATEKNTKKIFSAESKNWNLWDGTSLKKSPRNTGHGHSKAGLFHRFEVTTTTVPIPSDDLKGKIIGKEGRNIRALERAAGVEIIVDDTPGSIVISGFDPVRRQTARVALENLISDGRIQPARIEEVVEKSSSGSGENHQTKGEMAAYEAGIIDLDPRLLTVLGRLYFGPTWPECFTAFH